MGSLISRYYENSKKSVKNKNLSFLVKLSLNKCINCTRCTRYSQNVTGEYSFSLLGRGENSVISNYTKNFFIGEITGNVMDLCPVGASTSKLIAYDFRLWELVDTKFIDFLDVMHPPIRIDYRGLKIIRILPLSNNIIQEEWISDKLRYNFKSLFKNRFYVPFVKKNFHYISVSWKASFINIKNNYIKVLNFFVDKKCFFLKNIVFCNNTTDLYSFFFNKKYFKKLNFFNNFESFSKKEKSFRKNFMFNDKDLDYLKMNNFIFLNVNLRYEIPLLNFKIREKMTFDYCSIFVFGFILELNYIFEHLGNSLKNIIFFFKNKVLKNKETIVFFSSKKNNISIKNIIKMMQSRYYDINQSSTLKIFKKELNEYKYLNINKIFSLFKVNYDYENDNIKNNVIQNKKQLNILINQNLFNLKNYNFIVPRKFNFEQNSIFLNLFGVYSDFTYLLYRVDYKNLKNDWNLSEFFFSKFSAKNKKIKLSYIKFFFLPKKWIYNEYNLNLFNYNINYFSNIAVCSKKEFFNFKNFFFYNDKFSKNNNLFSYFKSLKKQNVFNFFNNINSIHWIF